MTCDRMILLTIHVLQYLVS